MKNNLHIYNYTVQETDLDFLGHVNNATYLKLLEQARWQLIHDRGYTFKKLIELQQSPVVLEINIKYLKELSARTQININTKFSEHIGKIGHLTQTITTSDQKIIFSEAKITYGLFDMKNRSLINPTKEWQQIINSTDEIVN